jgi:hypothetical protein
MTLLILRRFAAAIERVLSLRILLYLLIKSNYTTEGAAERPDSKSKNRAYSAALISFILLGCNKQSLPKHNLKNLVFFSKFANIIPINEHYFTPWKNVILFFNINKHIIL